MTSSSKQKPAGDRGRCPLNGANDQVGRSVSGFFAYVAAKYKNIIQRNLLEKDIFSQIHAANWSQLPFSRGGFLFRGGLVEIWLTRGYVLVGIQVTVVRSSLSFPAWFLPHALGGPAHHVRGDQFGQRRQQCCYLERSWKHGISWNIMELNAKSAKCFGLEDGEGWSVLTRLQMNPHDLEMRWDESSDHIRSPPGIRERDEKGRR